MSISNDDALEIINRLKLASWEVAPGTRAIYMDDAVMVVCEQTEMPKREEK